MWIRHSSEHTLCDFYQLLSGISCSLSGFLKHAWYLWSKDEHDSFKFYLQKMIIALKYLLFFESSKLIIATRIISLWSRLELNLKHSSRIGADEKLVDSLTAKAWQNQNIKHCAMKLMPWSKKVQCVCVRVCECSSQTWSRGNRKNAGHISGTYGNKSAELTRHKNKIRRNEQRKTIKKYSHSTIEDGQEDKSKTFALRPVSVLLIQRRPRARYSLHICSMLWLCASGSSFYFFNSFFLRHSELSWCWCSFMFQLKAFCTLAFVFFTHFTLNLSQCYLMHLHLWRCNKMNMAHREQRIQILWICATKANER